MLIERVCLALMLALVGDVFLGVFSRYILQATFQWYDEVARLCFIWIVFLGAAVAVKRGMHFRMRLVVDRLGPSAARFADRLVTLATMAFGAVLVAGGYGIYPIAQRQVTDALEISMLWFYAALPVGAR
ncbi:MAG: TRAP transporter small permease [Burkholderiaceae bacterium]|nr:TRAP transporter small permease [Burkholderiaceae bacterium]